MDFSIFLGGRVGFGPGRTIFSFSLFSLLVVYLAPGEKVTNSRQCQMAIQEVQGSYQPCTWSTFLGRVLSMKPGGAFPRRSKAASPGIPQKAFLILTVVHELS